MRENISKKEHIAEPPKDKAPLSEGNLVEQIDAILHDIGNSLPEGNLDRNEIILGSLELREWARRKHYEFSRERVIGRLKAQRPFFIFDYDVRNMSLSDPEDECRILGKASDQVTEQFLQRVGLLKPEESLAALKSSDRWGKSWPSRYPKSFITGTQPMKKKISEKSLLGSPVYNMDERYLETTMPGLSVSVVLNDVGKTHQVFCKFTRASMKGILQGVVSDSLFTPELNK